MADRELRHMRRTELVEIIFALKQSEDQLKAENAALTAQLEDLLTICEMALEEQDDSMLPELEEGFAQLSQRMEEARLETPPMTIWLRCGRSTGTPCRRRQRPKQTRSWHRPGPRRNS